MEKIQESTPTLTMTRIQPWNLQRYVDKKILFFIPSLQKYAFGRMRETYGGFHEFVLITKDGEAIYGDMAPDVQFYLIGEKSDSCSSW